MGRVLLVQPSLQPPGGGNGVAAWMLQALAREHQVTVLSWQRVDVAPINRFFGTSLRESTFETLRVPSHWRLVPDHLPVPATLVRSALLMRYTRRVSDAFDVVVGLHNEADYGRRGIQYVHFPTYLRPRPAADLRWYHRVPLVLDAYYRIADALGGFSVDRMKQNLTLANSHWTAERVRQSLGIEAQTLYPPVAGSPSPVPWTDRRNAFLAIGRISPEKAFERIIRIVARVRPAAPDLTLTIVGTWDRQSSGYYERLRALAESMGSWIEFRKDVSREDVQSLMATCRYGLHGMRDEHFGMAPAEMVMAGMIVWVPNGGGQREIVGNEPALVYDTDDHAVDSIRHVVGSTTAQTRLRGCLSACAERFGTDRFMAEARAVVAAFMAQPSS